MIKRNAALYKRKVEKIEVIGRALKLHRCGGGGGCQNQITHSTDGQVQFGIRCRFYKDVAN